MSNPKTKKKYKNLPKYKPEHEDDLRNENGAVPIPNNFFFNKDVNNVFQNTMEENHALEQFFWSKETVEKICGAARSLARIRLCLDIKISIC